MYGLTVFSSTKIPQSKQLLWFHQTQLLFEQSFKPGVVMFPSQDMHPLSEQVGCRDTHPQNVGNLLDCKGVGPNLVAVYHYPKNVAIGCIILPSGRVLSIRTADFWCCDFWAVFYVGHR